MLHPCPLVPAWVAHLKRTGIDSQGWVLSLELVTGCGGLPADFSLKVKGDTLQQWCYHTVRGLCMKLALEPRSRLAGSLIAFC